MLFAQEWRRERSTALGAAGCYSNVFEGKQTGGSDGAACTNLLLIAMACAI